MTLRIGYLTYGLDRAPTGIGRYAIELLRSLATTVVGAEIILLSSERQDRHGLWQHFETHHLPGCHLLPALMSVGNLLVSRAARRYQLDLIHDPNGIAPFLGRQTRTQNIVTIHDAFAYVHPETHNRLDTWRYRHMLPQAVRRVARVLTDSYHSRADLSRYLPLALEEIEVVYCGIDHHFKPVIDPEQRGSVLRRYQLEQPYILYVGAINGRKNIVRLFEAFALLAERRPGLKLVVGGKQQWHTQAIEAAYQRLGLADKVQFTGYLDDADLPALYSGAELFVFPSLYEGFGLPPLEALACGTPVVTSHGSSLPEVVGDAALLVDPYDVPGLAQAIELLLDDQPLRAELRKRGLARAAQFSWQISAARTWAIYQQVLEQASRPT